MRRHGTRESTGLAAVERGVPVTPARGCSAVVLAGAVLAGVPSWAQQPAKGKQLATLGATAPVKAIGLDLPDLKVQDLWIESDGQRVTGRLTLGAKYILVCQFANVGSDSKAAFKVGYYVDDRLVGSRGSQESLTTLRQQGFHSGVDYTPGREGKHRYECVLDWDNTLRERDKSNNRASITFEVQGMKQLAAPRGVAGGTVPIRLPQGPPFVVNSETLTVTGKAPAPTPAGVFAPVAVVTEQLTVTGKVATPTPAVPFTPVTVTVETLTVTGKP